MLKISFLILHNIANVHECEYEGYDGDNVGQ